MLKQEWKKLLGNKIMLIVIVAIIAIPTIYTTLFLGSMWDPYGNIDKLPVAVVNEDVPAVYGTSTLHVGDEMVKNLKKDASLDFTFTDQEAARRGLKDGSYYMVITIPENFSSNAATLTDKNRKNGTFIRDKSRNKLYCFQDERNGHAENRKLCSERSDAELCSGSI